SPYDYFHINSIAVADDDNLIVSARRTSAVYKIDRKSGEVIWRLGGKKSDFEMGPGTRTDWQHDARPQPDGTITIFDNGGVTKDEQSRGIVVKLDEDAMTATLVRAYTHPDKILSATQGSMQVLPNGNVFVGWGSEPALSEFDYEGNLRFDAAFPTEGESYRAFRFPWKGQPQDRPSIAAEAGADDKVTVYASWNGATQLADWEVLAGPEPGGLQTVGSAPRKGFETAITLETTEPFVGIRARNRAGDSLGAITVIEVDPRGDSAATGGAHRTGTA
ncbi:MAG: arylsulfotransferase family protein, partial [Rubrobacter sp.]